MKYPYPKTRSPEIFRAEETCKTLIFSLRNLGYTFLIRLNEEKCFNIYTTFSQLAKGVVLAHAMRLSNLGEAVFLWALPHCREKLSVTFGYETKQKSQPPSVLF